MFSTKTIMCFIKRIFNVSNTKPLGRWNIKENREIKEVMANLDSCGSFECGKPDTFRKHISDILK